MLRKVHTLTLARTRTLANEQCAFDTMRRHSHIRVKLRLLSLRDNIEKHSKNRNANKAVTTNARLITPHVREFALSSLTPYIARNEIQSGQNESECVCVRLSAAFFIIFFSSLEGNYTSLLHLFFIFEAVFRMLQYTLKFGAGTGAGPVSETNTVRYIWRHTLSHAPKVFEFGRPMFLDRIAKTAK